MKLNFINDYPIKALSAKDTEYWKEIVQRSIRIGIEFEFNLQKVVSGDDKTCLHVIQNTCTQNTICINDRHCQTHPEIRFCSNRSNDCWEGRKQCPCPDWKLDCSGINCITFTPVCFQCNDHSAVSVSDPKGACVKHPVEVRDYLRKRLSPSGYVGKYGKKSILSVVEDGSLEGDRGVEIPTVGKMVSYNSIFSTTKEVIEEVNANGGYVNERCSIHYHMLIGYLSRDSRGDIINVSDMETPLPALIMMNFIQLIRIYQSALVWMSSTGNDKNAFTRWEKFRESILNYSPIKFTNLQVMRDRMMRGIEKNGKYGFINVWGEGADLSQLDEEGDISRFHVELRYADGSLVPSAITSLAILNYALLEKAIELSYYGLIEIQELKEITELTQKILNGKNKGYDAIRISDNSGLEADDIKQLVAISTSLVDSVKHILVRYGSSYEVLRALALQPISARRIRGQDWQKIEADLFNISYHPNIVELPTVKTIFRCIDLQEVLHLNNLDEWINEVSQLVNIDTQEIKTVINSLLDSRQVKWSEELGSPMRIK